VGPGDTQITLESGPGWARVCVAGEVDLSSVGPVVDAVLQATPPSGRLEVDLRGVTFIDSSGMAGLERCRRRAVALGADLVVRCITGGAVCRLLGLTGMDRVLQVRAEAA
jgi:anti-anti-sigma factor